MARHWAFEIVGKPWADYARGPDEFSCWGLMCYAFETQRGLVLPWVPPGGDGVEAAIREAVKANNEIWTRAKMPLREWDVVTMRGPSMRRHVGLGVRANGGVQVLHCDGENVESGTVGSVKLESLTEIRSFYKDIELWRKT